jgi:chromosome segregation ATPase
MEFQPGANLNLVLGPNGTGKSSLVCALCIGLGANPKILKRGDHVKTYIMNGKPKAVVEIELYDETSTPRNHIVRRVMTRNEDSVTDSWSINNKSSTHKKVQGLLKDLNIALDNMCQFLPQDQVGNFSGMKPTDMLKETIKAVLGVKVVEEQQALVEYQKHEQEEQRKVEALRHEVEELNAKNKSLEAGVTEQQNRQELIDQAALLNSKCAWLDYDGCLKDWQEAVKVAKAAKAQHQAAKQKIVPLEQNIKDLQLAEKAEQDNFKKKKQLEMKFAREREKEYCRHEDRMETILSFDRELDQIEKEQGNAESNLRKEQKKHARAQEELAGLSSIEASKKKADAAKKSYTNLKADVLKLQQDRDGFQAERRPIGNEIRQLQREVAQLESTKGQKQAQFIQAYKFRAKQAMLARRYIDNNPEKFRRKIWGPIALEVTIKDEANQATDAAQVERLIGGSMATFVTECDADRKAVDKFVLGEQKIKVDHYLVEGATHVIYPYEGKKMESKFSQRPYTAARFAELQRQGVKSYADELFDAPEAVKAMLCKRHNIHTVLTATPQAERALDDTTSSLMHLLRDRDQRNGIKKGAWSLLTPGYERKCLISMYGAKAEVTSMVQVQPAKVLQVQSGGSDVQEKKVHIQELQAEYQKHETNEKKAEAEQKKLKEKQGKFTEEARKHQSAQALYIAQEKKVESLERQVQKAESKLNEDFDEKRKSIEKRKELAKKKLLKGLTDVSAKTKACLEIHNLEMVGAALRYKHVEEIRRRAQNEIHVSQRDEREKEQELNAAKGKRVTLKTELTKLLADARLTMVNLGDEEWKATNPALLEKFNALPEDYNSNKAEYDRTSALVQSVGDNPEVIAQYERSKREAEEKKAELEAKEAAIVQNRAGVADQRSKWTGKIKTMISKIDTDFSASYKEMGCTGEVRIGSPNGDLAVPADYNEWALLIRVSYRTNMPLSNLKADRQSGGERTVATILYLMALQKRTSCPFRLVDEINQGMDAKNEKAVFQQIVRLSTGDTPQYFLITPKLLQNLEYTNNVTVLVVFNGPYNIAFKEMNRVREFITKKRELNARNAGVESAKRARLTASAR